MAKQAETASGSPRTRGAESARWVTGVFTLGALSAVAATGLAAPAAADGGTYLEALQPRYTSMSASQLISAGNSVCSAAASGLPASDIVPMLVKHYGISASAAYEITITAINHLGC
ncbi:DUF732 domain-containing protein [Mycobacterium sp. ITM-2016-00318]|uniref:DUF732 domain-containing protein n=1 Tax=Mycobacterium sp. ITM-2016-00318 TaxID=2099693 RepID=UPI001304B9C8|nr:DUF732 domain-containing protein [Mycobacterium sp. ITM-2016-00318]WNG92092.1 DUF732 domain-containing protein [Mycobacterium sp. ITM-2016-00318]